MDQIQAVIGVYGLCCSHLVHIQKKRNKCFTHCFSIPHLQYPPVEVSFLLLHISFVSVSVCSSISFPIPFVSTLSPPLLIFSPVHYPALPRPPSPHSSKLIALKHSRLLTSTPLCPPQSHITQSPLVLTSFCT